MTSGKSAHRGGGRRQAAAALGILALIGAALLVFALTSQTGAPPQPELRSGSTGASDGGGPQPSAAPAEPSSTNGLGESEPVEQSEADEPAVAPLEASEPTSLTIPAIGVSEQVFPIGLGPEGELLAPSGERAHQPAWFESSPTPGEDGPSVIEGHVTWGGEPSIFFDLGGLAPGDRIDVEREDGTVATFEVYDSARFAKDEFPTLTVYGRTDGPELRVITCSGDLDADGRHLDNVVVFARLVAS